MITNVNMTRRLGNYEVVQRTSDSYFDANHLLHQWNSVSEHSLRKMDEFLESPKTKEFIEIIKERESKIVPKHTLIQNSDNDVLAEDKNATVSLSPKREISLVGDFQVVIKGKKRTLKEGGSLPAFVWMHPLLFIDFAMWLNPSFKYDVLKFVYDEMIKYRNLAGDTYKKLSTAVYDIVGKEQMKYAMPKVSRALNLIVFNHSDIGERDKHACSDLQAELHTLEGKVADLVSEGFLNTLPDILSYLHKTYNIKYK